MSGNIYDFYLNCGDSVPVGDDAEFEQKHPRKGGKFAKKGEGGGDAKKNESIDMGGGFKLTWDNLMSTVASLDLGRPLNAVENAELTLVKSDPRNAYLDLKGMYGKMRERLQQMVKSGESELASKKNGGGSDDGKLKVSDIKVSEKDGEITAFAPEGVSVDQDVRKKMIAAIIKKHPDKKFTFSKAKNGEAEGIKAVESKGETDLSKLSDVELGKKVAEARNGKKSAEEIAKFTGEQDKRYAKRCAEMSDDELKKAIDDNEKLVDRYGKDAEKNPYVRDLAIAKKEQNDRILKKQKEKDLKEIEAEKKDSIAKMTPAIAKRTGVSEDKVKEILEKHYDSNKNGWKGLIEKVEKEGGVSVGDESEEKSVAVELFDAAEWDENAHPRAKDGRFGKKAGEHGKKEIKGFVSETAYKQFAAAYDRAYSHFYENEDPREILYTDMFIKEMHNSTDWNVDFKAKLDEFVAKREDPVSSDRELAAFWSAWSGVDPTKHEPNALEKELGEIYKKRQQLWLNSGDADEQKRLGQEYVKKFKDWMLGSEESSSSNKTETKESKGAETAKKIIGELDRYWQDRYAMLDEQGHSLINAVFEKVQTKQPQMLMKQSIMICEENQRYANEYSKKMSLMSTKTGLPVSELEHMRDQMKDMLATDENFLHLENDSHVFEYERNGNFNVMTKDQWYRSKGNDYLVRKAKELNIYVKMFKGSDSFKRWEKERNLVTSILAERSGSGK